MYNIFNINVLNIINFYLLCFIVQGFCKLPALAESYSCEDIIIFVEVDVIIRSHWTVFIFKVAF